MLDALCFSLPKRNSIDLIHIFFACFYCFSFRWFVSRVVCKNRVCVPMKNLFRRIICYSDCCLEWAFCVCVIFATCCYCVVACCCCCCVCAVILLLLLPAIWTMHSMVKGKCSCMSTTHVCRCIFNNSFIYIFFLLQLLLPIWLFHPFLAEKCEWQREREIACWVRHEICLDGCLFDDGVRWIFPTPSLSLSHPLYVWVRMIEKKQHTFLVEETLSVGNQY